jgi:murein DD-endopeptidase MepM/ murein hydrolase activator NlpD
VAIAALAALPGPAAARATAAPPPDGPGAVVIRPFQPPAQRWLPGHRGVDLLGHPGAAVRAAAGGVVLLAGSVAGRPVVVVGHGAARTTYEPVSAEVEVGQRVAAGQRLGRLVAEGSHCQPAACLHLGLIQRQVGVPPAGRTWSDSYLDPMLLLHPQPRLLPLPGPAVASGQARG